MIKVRKVTTIIVFIIITLDSLCSEETVFNYYKRSFFGEYELKNIDYGDLLEGIKPPKYVATYDDDSNITKIKGYYIGGKRLKFGDIIKNGKVFVTLYFDYDTKKIIYFKKYIREDGKLKKIELQAIRTVISNKINYVEEYRYEKDRIEIKNEIIVTHLKKKNLEARYVGRGYYDLKYNPLSITWLFYKTDKDGKELSPIKIEERCEYNVSGQITKSISTFPKTNEELALFLYHYDTNSKLIKEEQWDYNRTYYFVNYYNGNNVKRYTEWGKTEKTKGEDSHKIIPGYDGLLRAIKWIHINPWSKEKRKMKEIFFNDESYLFEFKNGKLYDITAKLRLQYLWNKYFILPPYNFSDIYDAYTGKRLKRLYEK